MNTVFHGGLQFKKTSEYKLSDDSHYMPNGPQKTWLDSWKNKSKKGNSVWILLWKLF